MLLELAALEELQAAAPAEPPQVAVALAEPVGQLALLEVAGTGTPASPSTPGRMRRTPVARVWR